jgi:hypothetical protein
VFEGAEDVLDAATEGDVAAADDVGLDTAPEYKSSLFPPPQYSFAFPPQVVEQSAVFAFTDPALSVFPQ